MRAGTFSNLRGAQSRSATPRTSVAQHSGLLLAPEQRAAWRSSRVLLPGTAAAMAVVAPTRATTMVWKRMIACVSEVGWFFWVEVFGKRWRKYVERDLMDWDGIKNEKTGGSLRTTLYLCELVHGHEFPIIQLCWQRYDYARCQGSFSWVVPWSCRWRRSYQMNRTAFCPHTPPYDKVLEQGFGQRPTTGHFPSATIGARLLYIIVPA